MQDMNRGRERVAQVGVHSREFCLLVFLRSMVEKDSINFEGKSGNNVFYYL